MVCGPALSRAAHHARVAGGRRPAFKQAGGERAAFTHNVNYAARSADSFRCLPRRERLVRMEVQIRGSHLKLRIIPDIMLSAANDSPKLGAARFARGVGKRSGQTGCSVTLAAGLL